MSNIGAVKVADVTATMYEYSVPNDGFVVKEVDTKDGKKAIQVGIYLEQWGITHKMGLCYDSRKKKYYISLFSSDHPNIVKFDANDNTIADTVSDIVRQIFAAYTRRRLWHWVTIAFMSNIAMIPVWAIVLGNAG